MPIEEIISLSIACLICLALFIFVVSIIKKKTVWAVLFVESALLITFGALKYNIATLAMASVYTVTLFLVFFVNIGEVRKYFSIPLTSATIAKKGMTKQSNLKLVENISSAVRWLSDNKTGALITFERGDSLDKYIESGTLINTPVTPEIIETIFYEGTRLHDGAIVIRNDTIVAASVFFTATTRNLVGKFGARHRAALGVSEMTDSVTIVVSEETGRISIAVAGMLEAVGYDEFEKVFSTFMNTNPDYEDNAKSMSEKDGQ